MKPTTDLRVDVIPTFEGTAAPKACCYRTGAPTGLYDIDSVLQLYQRLFLGFQAPKRLVIKQEPSLAEVTLGFLLEYQDQIRAGLGHQVGEWCRLIGDVELLRAVGLAMYDPHLADTYMRLCGEVENMRSEDRMLFGIEALREVLLIGMGPSAGPQQQDMFPFATGPLHPYWRGGAALIFCYSEQVLTDSKGLESPVGTLVLRSNLLEGLILKHLAALEARAWEVLNPVTLAKAFPDEDAAREEYLTLRTLIGIDCATQEADNNG